ncbi:MAG: Beta-lactamase class [Frankiales bacterium]|nr:Beta-lactamase class [Frankiales bacterium]
MPDPIGRRSRLPRSTPMQEGLAPGLLVDFLRGFRRRGLSLDSLMIARHGRVVVEKWWWPHSPEQVHTLHSATKSITGTAAGFALAEGLLRLDDRVVDFFPDQLPRHVSPYLTAMRVRDLLTMRTGHASGISGATWRTIPTSWIREFLDEPVAERPGKRFVYSSATSHVLGAAVAVAAGQDLLAYLTPRLFGPLGISDVIWDRDPEGYRTGGNGLSLRTEDFLAYGQLHLQDGRWNGRQVLPQGWVRQATHRHVVQAAAGVWDGQRFVGGGADDSPGPTEGYGYHLWLGADGSYNAGGIFGQYCIVVPHLDLVLAMTGSIGEWKHRDVPDLVSIELLGRLDQARADWRSAEALERWQGELDAGAEPPQDPPQARQVPPGRCWRYRLEPNELSIRELRFEFAANHVTFVQTDDVGTHRVRCGLSAWSRTSTSIPSGRLHHFYQADDMPLSTRAWWHGPEELILTWHFVGTPFIDTVECLFGEDGSLELRRRVNVNTGSTELPSLFGRRSEQGSPGRLGRRSRTIG